MAGQLHQMIVGLIGRKMREKGYDIVAFDGKEYLFDGQQLNVPLTIKRHKPDIVGYKFNTMEVCVGEAKTSNDLSSVRTREQLLDYSNTQCFTTGKHIEIIVGIPKSAEQELLMLLKRLSLFGKEYISYIWLPEELVGNGKEDQV